VRGGNVLHAECLDLGKATDKGLVVLPPPELPVKERATLTVEKRSGHFLFRYRPGSYAESHIDQAVRAREAAYEKLRALLRMELPVTVTIDLYPDMEAKGLGKRHENQHGQHRQQSPRRRGLQRVVPMRPCHELAHISRIISAAKRAAFPKPSPTTVKRVSTRAEPPRKPSVI